MHLNEYPRPKGDNGIGIHFGHDLRQASLDSFTEKMAAMRVTWCLVPHKDDSELQRAAIVIGSAGIIPVSRSICQIDQNILDFAGTARVLRDLGLPAYVQIFNEPSEEREWRDGVPKPRVFVARWCDHAARVAEEGGYPGLQVLHAQELRTVLKELMGRGAKGVIDRMWFCPHPYGHNHPPDYPYDKRNQYDHPGATLFTDDSSVLQFLEFGPIFEEELGFVPPFIAGEGGWQYRNAEDGRYTKIDDKLHAQYHIALFDWFRSGLLSNGEPVPDYLFAFCPWILFGLEADAWYSQTTGTRQVTIDALRALPAFSRRSSGRGTLRPAPPSARALSHYVLLGSNSSLRRARLIVAREYITRFQISFGFSTADAARAERVTIMGSRESVSENEEALLKQAGCRVERLIGDDYALRIILADRVARNAEFG